MVFELKKLGLKFHLNLKAQKIIFIIIFNEFFRVCPSTVFYLIDQIVTNATVRNDLLTRVDWLIVPMVSYTIFKIRILI